MHFILSRDGYDTVTSHVFDPDDPYLHFDAVFGVKESLVGTFERVEDKARIERAGFDGGFYWELAFDWVMAPKDA